MKRDKHGVCSVKSSSKHSILSVSVWSRMVIRRRALVGSKILEKGDIIDHLTFKVFLEDKGITSKDNWNLQKIKEYTRCER